MEDYSKCFIKMDNGKYNEITYKELKVKRQKDINFRDKKFIPIHGMLLEVSTEDYKEFYKNIERNRYIRKLSKEYGLFSINSISEQKEIDVIKDENVNVEFEVERKIEVERLKNVLLKLDEDEYKIVKALFYEKKTVREYATKVGIPFTTIQSRKIKILNKLKKLLE